MALIDLIEKGADGDLVRDLLAYAAERMMELDVEVRTGAAAGQRSPDPPHAEERLPGAGLRDELCGGLSDEERQAAQ